MHSPNKSFNELLTSTLLRTSGEMTGDATTAVLSRFEAFVESEFFEITLVPVPARATRGEKRSGNGREGKRPKPLRAKPGALKACKTHRRGR